jgi:hypothetical protein
MTIKLRDLLPESHESFHKGESKSGLDWDGDSENPDTTTNETPELTSDLVEMYEGDDDALDNRQLKSYIMSIHKMAAELYNVLDETDDPEDWVIEQAKECNSLINAIHGHVSYNKKKAEELNSDVGSKAAERGW